MTSRGAATRYARALFDVAVKERADLDQIERQLADFITLIAQHADLEQALLNPVVPATRKRAALAELVGRLGLVPVLGKLLVLLAERDRLSLLGDLLTAYRERLQDHRQVVRAVVTTAVPLAADRLEQIGQRLEQVTGRTVLITPEVDPAILGGVVARVGSLLFDGSVARQLSKIRDALVAD
jgi:F-type H+-transporting ATPase subunit delta